jgi:O-antigen/teichoic acid export membrane protein
MTILNPVVGLFTSVYYAENHVAVRDQDTDEGSKIGKNWTVAVIAAICFAALGTVIFFIKIPLDHMRYWLLVAVSPSLFCLGVRITARALFRDFQDEMNAAKDKKHSQPTLSFFVPVSLTIILTHIIDFELALPIGIIYFGVSSNIPFREWRDKLGANFRGIWFASLFVAGVVGFVHLEAYLGERTEHPVVECGKLLEQNDIASAKALCPYK